MTLSWPADPTIHGPMVFLPTQRRHGPPSVPGAPRLQRTVVHYVSMASALGSTVLSSDLRLHGFTAGPWDAYGIVCPYAATHGLGDRGALQPACTCTVPSTNPTSTVAPTAPRTVQTHGAPRSVSSSWLHRGTMDLRYQRHHRSLRCLLRTEGPRRSSATSPAGSSGRSYGPRWPRRHRPWSGPTVHHGRRHLHGSSAVPWIHGVLGTVGRFAVSHGPWGHGALYRVF